MTIVRAGSCSSREPRRRDRRARRARARGCATSTPRSSRPCRQRAVVDVRRRCRPRSSAARTALDVGVGREVRDERRRRPRARPASRPRRAPRARASRGVAAATDERRTRGPARGALGAHAPSASFIFDQMPFSRCGGAWPCSAASCLSSFLLLGSTRLRRPELHAHVQVAGAGRVHARQARGRAGGTPARSACPAARAARASPTTAGTLMSAPSTSCG